MTKGLKLRTNGKLPKTHCVVREYPCICLLSNKTTIICHLQKSSQQETPDHHKTLQKFTFYDLLLIMTNKIHGQEKPKQQESNFFYQQAVKELQFNYSDWFVIQLCFSYSSTHFRFPSLLCRFFLSPTPTSIKQRSWS